MVIIYLLQRGSGLFGINPSLTSKTKVKVFHYPEITPAIREGYLMGLNNQSKILFRDKSDPRRIILLDPKDVLTVVRSGEKSFWADNMDRFLELHRHQKTDIERMFSLYKKTLENDIKEGRISTDDFFSTNFNQRLQKDLIEIRSEYAEDWENIYKEYLKENKIPYSKDKPFGFNDPFLGHEDVLYLNKLEELYKIYTKAQKVK